MRCDVCDTKIPPGADRCPNCGYRVRHSSTATHTQATSANYPEPEVFKPKRNKKFIYHVEKNHVIVLNEQKHLLLKNTLFL